MRYADVDGKRCLPEKGLCIWHKDMRFSRTKHASYWKDSDTHEDFTIPKGSLCIPLDWYFKKPGEPRVYEWERIIKEHEQLANGWTKPELNGMRDFLRGELWILDGLLRIMPSPIGDISLNMTVSAAKDHLARAEKHIAAGRLPILKEATKERLIESAEAFERREYGGLLQHRQKGHAGDSRQQQLF